MATGSLSGEDGWGGAERQIALLFHQLPGVVWSTDRDLRVTHAMGRDAREAGFDARTLVGRTVYEIVGTRDPTEPAIAHHLAALAGRRASFRYELRDHCYEVLIQPLSAGDGPIGCVGSAMDVTERREREERSKQAASKLERTCSLLRATLHATADGVLVVDRDGAITIYNQRFIDLWRIPPELADSRDERALLRYAAEQLEDPAGFTRGVQELYQSPERESFDVLHLTEGRVFERISRPQRIGEQIVGRVWTFHDVTDRERNLRSTTFLSDATRLLASLDMRQALEGVARLAVPYLGDACAVDLVTLGQPQRLLSVVRDPARPIVVTSVPRAVLAGHATLFRRGALSCISVPILTKEGLAGLITFAGAPGRRYQEEDVALADELGRRTALAIENARAMDRAREALRARDEFLSIAAHEIRGPVTSIHLAVQTLLERGGLDESRARLLDAIERADRRLTRFVDELLDVGRIQSDRFHFQYEEVNLAELVREVVGRLEDEAARAGSALSVIVEREVLGEWDRFRLDQVITNLLSNAIKFGQGKPIDISVGADETTATLVVRDRGLGIARDKIERIFRPFERAVPGRQYGGLGLGLYIVRTIVEGLGGEIRVETELGGGSTFTLHLPLTRSE